MYGNDDSDMKIVGSVSSGKAKAPDEGEADALIFEHERDNGNLEKAHATGRLFADELLGEHGIAFEPEASVDFVARNRAVLFAFAADQAISSRCPNSIIAQSAENEFYDEIRRRNPFLYETISRSGAFSIYLLCKRTEDGRRAGIGKAFAKIIRQPEDSDAEKEGEECFEKYLFFCSEHFNNIAFSV